MKRSSDRRIILHDFKNAVSSGIGIAILGLAAFMIMIPMPLFAFWETSLFNLEYTHLQLKFRFCSPELAPYIGYAAALFGAVLGGFYGRFLLERREAKFYLSLGVRRSSLMLTRIAAGAAVTVFALGIPLITAYIINLASLGSYTGMLSYFLTLTAGLILNALVFMLIFMLGCCFAGNRTEMTVYSASLLLMPEALTGCVNTSAAILLRGCVWGKVNHFGTAVGESVTDMLSWLNPLRFFAEDAIKYSEFSRTLDTASPAPVDLRLIIGWGVADGRRETAMLIRIRCRRGQKDFFCGTIHSLFCDERSSYHEKEI
ncbi:MAG: hypothetical protein HUJ65_03255, partial [Oscillospiraceae bacterium]|nr:hypothetical protein [Oscillospiraceae bacterium]